MSDYEDDFEDYNDDFEDDEDVAAAEAAAAAAFAVQPAPQYQQQLPKTPASPRQFATSTSPTSVAARWRRSSG